MFNTKTILFVKLIVLLSNGDLLAIVSPNDVSSLLELTQITKNIAVPIHICSTANEFTCLVHREANNLLPFTHYKSLGNICTVIVHICIHIRK